MLMKDIQESTNLIRQWAHDRNLTSADPNKQMLKLMKEVGELAQGMAKGNEEQITDSIGDVYVVLTILSTQLGFYVEDCVNDAYNEIKDRKGKLINGTFVKEADLQEG